MKRKFTTYSSSFVDSLTHWRPGNTTVYFNKSNHRIKSQKAWKNRDEEIIRRILGTLCNSRNVKKKKNSIRWYKLIAKNWNKILLNRLILLVKKLLYSKKNPGFLKKKKKRNWAIVWNVIDQNLTDAYK